MATGDNGKTAAAVARELGIDEVRADMLPEGKKALIDELRAKGRIVAMATSASTPMACRAWFFAISSAPSRISAFRAGSAT